MCRKHYVSYHITFFSPAIVKLKRGSNINGSCTSLPGHGKRLLSDMWKFAPGFTLSKPQTTVFKWTSYTCPGLYMDLKAGFTVSGQTALGLTKEYNDTKPQVVHRAMPWTICEKTHFRHLQNTNELAVANFQVIILIQSTLMNLDTSSIFLRVFSIQIYLMNIIQQFKFMQ